MILQPTELVCSTSQLIRAAQTAAQLVNVDGPDADKAIKGERT